MLRRTRLLPAVLWLCAGAHATELTPNAVVAAVTTWVQQATADARPRAEIVALKPYTVAGRPVAYIATLSTGGFALCGADNRLLPVYLYSADNPYDVTDPVNQEILADIGRRLLAFEAAEAAGNPILAEYRAELSKRLDLWRDLQSGRVPLAAPSRSGPTAMTLPVTDAWHQGAPYNHACPVLTPGTAEHAVVGCVATAMAEIMYYWKWPITGEGSGSTTYYYRYSDVWLTAALDHDPLIPSGWAGGDRLLYTPPQQTLAMHGYWDGSIYDGAMHLTDDPNGTPDPEYIAALESLWSDMTQDTRTCPANFGATTFDWSEIQDVHTEPDGPEDQEVAWLCFCAGVAVEMGYGVWSSGSHTWRAAEAYSDHFRYDPAAVYEDGVNVSTLISEIQWLRPVQLAGFSDNGGHSFVVCGYNEGVSPPQFLINKGWGGGSTSWLTLDQFFPENQNQVTHIAPLGVVRFVGGLNGGTGDGSPSDPYGDLNEAAAEHPTGATIIFRAGSVTTCAPGGVVFSRACTLKGLNAVLQSE